MPPTDPWLSRYAKLVVAATFCLIFLGGMVTSKDAGLSVPDWPTSYGYSMFTFPVSRWIGGIFFEHVHRLVASGVGLLTTILAAWIWRNRWAFPAALVFSGVATGAVAIALAHRHFDEPSTRGLIIMHVNIWSYAAAFAGMLLCTERGRWRHGARWLQWLAFGAFLLVCVQGTLGGLRVTEVSIVLAMVHACTAQLFLALLVIIAAALSPRWFPNAARAQRVPAAIRVLSWVLVGAIYAQLMIGAVMRHLHAGLSIPTFPLAFGYWIPPMINERVAIHFSHRVGALVVTLLAIALSSSIFAAARRQPLLVRPAAGLLALLVVQVALGASVIWLRREPVMTSLHVVNGAAVLATALLLALRAARLDRQSQPESRAREQARLHEAHA